MGTLKTFKMCFLRFGTLCRMSRNLPFTEILGFYDSVKNLSHCAPVSSFSIASASSSPFLKKLKNVLRFGTLCRLSRNLLLPKNWDFMTGWISSKIIPLCSGQRFQLILWYLRCKWAILNGFSDSELYFFCHETCLLRKIWECKKF